MFTQSTITSVAPPRYQGPFVHLLWTTSAPNGTWFQVYVNRVLVWDGQSIECWIAAPTTTDQIEIGSVDAGEETLSFARPVGYGVGGYGNCLYGGVSPIPELVKSRALLTWQGGTFEGADIAGFFVYGSTVAGGSISYTTPLATITAYPAGLETTGYGMGGYGMGGYGTTTGTYTWTSEALLSGTWSYAVVPFDAAGNSGGGSTTSVVIAVPPTEPGLFPDGTDRLRGFVVGYGELPYGEGGYGESGVLLEWNTSTG